MTIDYKVDVTARDEGQRETPVRCKQRVNTRVLVIFVVSRYHHRGSLRGARSWDGVRRLP